MVQVEEFVATNGAVTTGGDFGAGLRLLESGALASAGEAKGNALMGNGVRARVYYPRTLLRALLVRVHGSMK